MIDADEVRDRVESAVHSEIQIADVNQALRFKEYDKIHATVSDENTDRLLSEMRMTVSQADLFLINSTDRSTDSLSKNDDFPRFRLEMAVLGSLKPHFWMLFIKNLPKMSKNQMKKICAKSKCYAFDVKV